MDRLEFGYSHGYTDALCRVQDAILTGLLDDMKRHKRRVTQKELLAVLDCMIAGREHLRDNPFTFVRCAADGGYEIYDLNKQQVCLPAGGKNERSL